MDMHVFFRSVGQWTHNALQAAGGWFRWVWESLWSWADGLPIQNAMKFFSNDTMNRYFFFGFLIYILIMNIWAFALFGADKASAKKKGQRVRESRLLGICFFGGAIGGMTGMYLFRHKTLKKRFSIGVPMLFIIQLVLDSFVLGFLGFWTFF